MLCYRNEDCRKIHSLVIEHFYHDKQPIGCIRAYDPDEDVERMLDLYHGMRLMVTYNYNKRLAVFNGVEVIVTGFDRAGIHVRLTNGLPYLLWSLPLGAKGKVYHVASAYGVTVHKAQGLTLNVVAVWLQGQRLPKGLAYTALSRVSSRKELFLFGSLSWFHFGVVELPAWLR